MKTQTKRVWRKSMVNLTVAGLLGMSVLPWMAMAQQGVQKPKPGAGDNAPARAPRIGNPDSGNFARTPAVPSRSETTRPPQAPPRPSDFN